MNRRVKHKPNQPSHDSAADCVKYCQNRIDDFYRSFGLFSNYLNVTIGYNVTSGFKCQCYNAGVGLLSWEMQQRQQEHSLILGVSFWSVDSSM